MTYIHESCILQTYTKRDQKGVREVIDNAILDTEEMANRLVELRGKRTQDEVAKALNISKSALAMYESGKRIPRDPVKIRIARFYNRSVPFIFFNQKNHEM